MVVVNVKGEFCAKSGQLTEFWYYKKISNCGMIVIDKNHKE